MPAASEDKMLLIKKQLGQRNGGMKIVEISSQRWMSLRDKKATLHANKHFTNINVLDDL